MPQTPRASVRNALQRVEHKGSPQVAIFNTTLLQDPENFQHSASDVCLDQSSSHCCSTSASLRRVCCRETRRAAELSPSDGDRIRRFRQDSARRSQIFLQKMFKPPSLNATPWPRAKVAGFQRFQRWSPPLPATLDRNDERLVDTQSWNHHLQCGAHPSAHCRPAGALELLEDPMLPPRSSHKLRMSSEPRLYVNRDFRKHLLHPRALQKNACPCGTHTAVRHRRQGASPP